MSLARQTSPEGATAVVVGTLNVRHTADRWAARAPLLLEQLEELDPDIIGLQEVRRLPGQARWIATAVARRGGLQQQAWEVRTAYKTGVKRLWEGIAVLSRLPIIGHARLRLGADSRVAQRVTVGLPHGPALDVYNVHLADGGEDVRTAQAGRLLAWMDERPDVPTVLVGDLNSRPGSAPVRALTTRLRSAYALVHGSEPPRTVPRGPVLDYILVDDRIVVADAWVTFDRPDSGDPQLLPSDHFGLAASVSVRPAGSPPRPPPR